MKHKWPTETKVRYLEDRRRKGTIVCLTTLGLVVEGDCSRRSFNDPWYGVLWGDGSFGQESEDSLEKV